MVCCVVCCADAPTPRPRHNAFHTSGNPFSRGREGETTAMARSFPPHLIALHRRSPSDEPPAAVCRCGRLESHPHPHHRSSCELAPLEHLPRPNPSSCPPSSLTLTHHLPPPSCVTRLPSPLLSPSAVKRCGKTVSRRSRCAHPSLSNGGRGRWGPRRGREEIALATPPWLAYVAYGRPRPWWGA